MGAGGIVLIYRTEEVFKNILLFWVVCALDKSCIEPTRALYCNRSAMKMNKFAGKCTLYFKKEKKNALVCTQYLMGPCILFILGCHRFDQSTLGLLLANHYNFNFSLYRDYMAKSDHGTFLSVKRGSYVGKKIKMC